LGFGVLGLGFVVRTLGFGVWGLQTNLLIWCCEPATLNPKRIGSDADFDQNARNARHVLRQSAT